MTETRSLPVRLTDDELMTRAGELAEACAKVELEESRQANLKAQLKADLARLEAERSKLTHIVAQRAEYRDVPVVEDYDPVRGVVETVREDTGAVIATRPATDADRQLLLPVTEKDRLR